MKPYRQAIKEYFEGIPAWKAMLSVDFIFWGLGLALYILGGCLVSASWIASTIIESIGLWTAIFGLALAFIKKDDWGLMITTAGIAIFSLVMFIINVAGYYSIFDFGGLMDVLVYTTLFIMALRASDILRQAGLRRAQEAAMMAQQMRAAGGAVCPSCGAVMAGDAMFCNVCGAKRPEAKKCSSCGEPLADGVLFCNKCGTKVEARVCSSCGKALAASDTFCAGCGAKTPTA